MKIIFILFIIYTFPTVLGQVVWEQRGLDIDGEAPEDESGFFISLSSDGSVVAISAPYNDGDGNDRGHVRVYQLKGNEWLQRGSDIDGEADFDNSGYSVSLSSDGSVVAIGAPSNNGNYQGGHVRIYEWNENEWQQRGSDIDGEEYDNIGTAVSLSADGSTVAIGAAEKSGVNGDNSGLVRIYQWTGRVWRQRGSDIYGETDSLSGTAVSLSSDGSIVAIGAPANAVTGESSVRVYDWDGVDWVQLGSTIDGEETFDRSGFTVSLSSDGSVIAIGAPSYSGEDFDFDGLVRVFQWNGSEWFQRGLDIKNESSFVTTGFGSEVSLSSDGSVVAISAPFGGENFGGYVRMYEWSGNQWQQRGSDIDGESFEDSSWAVSLSSDGSVVATGANLNDGNGVNSGHVRIFAIPPVIGLKKLYESYEGESITIDATPAGGSPSNFTFQWYFGQLTIPENLGGADSQFTIQGVKTNVGKWRVEVTSTVGTTVHEFEYIIAIDTDGDGLSDFRETNIFQTDPSLADTDGDGLDDRAEIEAHETDPLKADTNEDGFRDGLAVQFGLDPLIDLGALREEILGQLADARANSEITSVTDSKAKLRIVIEQSEDLSDWNERETVEVTIPLENAETKKFLRFKIKE